MYTDLLFFQDNNAWEGHKNREKLKTCLKTKIKKFPSSSIQTIYHIIYIFAELCEINFLDLFLAPQVL